MSDDDWLDNEWLDDDPNEVIQAILEDTASARNRNVVPVDGLPDKHKRIALALKALTWRQRVWLKAYLEGGCTRKGAVRVLSDQRHADLIPDYSTVTRWHHTEQYTTALSLLKAHYVELAGLDAEGVLLKTQVVLDAALTPQPILHMGEDTGFREINGNVAMRAIEFAGKVNKMVNGEDAGPRVTLVVNIANRDDLEVVSTQ